MSNKERLSVNVDRELVEHLQQYWGDISLTRIVNRALLTMCKYDPRLLEAREYDLLNSLQIPEVMKAQLKRATGAKTWQGAAMDILVEYLENLDGDHNA